MLSTRNPPQNKGHTWAENEDLEKDISWKQMKRKQEKKYSSQIK